MKRLTMNQVAKATLSVNRKTYISLFLGILLAVYLTSTTCLCAWGTIRAHEEQMARKVGWMDIFLMGSDGPTDEQLRRCGFFRELGHVTVTASVDGTQVYTGYYDETAEKLMNRRLREGRMPEKAGEIAAERSALMRLEREEAGIGDTLTLTMHPVNGTEEKRTFTLVGILEEQTVNLDLTEYLYEPEDGMAFPALLVSPEEPAYSVGGTAVHRVMTYAPLITYNQVLRNLKLDLGISFGVSRERGSIEQYDSGWDRAARTLSRIALWGILGAALLLVSCVGIASAMESLLARKTEDIGMLRAIGATRRQIRRVYGREAWILSLTALPAGIAAGILTAWLISRAAPDQMVFALSPWLLIPMIAVPALCVFIASRVPLYRASRQMPMGVLRDTAMLRRAGSFKSRGHFSPAGLIARRQLRLHPMRRIGAIGMTALTLACLFLLGELLLSVAGWNERDDQAAFQLQQKDRFMAIEEDAFSQTAPADGTARADLRRIASMEEVAKVQTATEINVNLLMEDLPEYFRSRQLVIQREGENYILMGGALNGSYEGSGWLFLSGEELADAVSRREEDWEAWQAVRTVNARNALQQALGITDAVVPVRMYVATLDEENLKDSVTAGTIDLPKLDSGEQVLVYAPTVCMGNRLDEEARNIHGNINYWLSPDEIREDEWDVIIRNDAFEPGMPLRLLEMAGNGEVLPEEGGDLQGYYRNMESILSNVTIGAVLTGSVPVNEYMPHCFTLITTEKGAEAMGLRLPNPDYADVYLTGDPSPETEQRLQSELEQTAMRSGMQLINTLQDLRDYLKRRYDAAILFGGLMLLFCAVSVSMLVSAASRQIRSEIRTIGTLRAVGADLKTLTACYRLPVLVSAGCGLLLALAMYALTARLAWYRIPETHPKIIIPLLAALAAGIAAACMTGIRRRMVQATRQSITENIREL